MTNEQTPRPRKKRTPDAAAAPQADLDGVVDAAADVVESAAAALRDAVPEAEPLEVPIVGTAGNDVDALRTSTAEAVEELEVEIRNSSAGQADARNAAAEALRLIRENLERLSPGGVEQVTQMLRQNVFNSDYVDPDFWRGIGMVLQYQVDEINGLVQRRLKGEYALDAYGMDQELIELVRPFAAFLYRTYWRVSAEGLHNVPASGAGLLVANRGGVLPWDSAMIATALLEEHPAARLVRNLHEPWLSGVPGMAPMLAAFGQVPALPENATRLLEAGELVVAYPEGSRGAGKLFRDRYQLASFNAAGGFVQAALRSGAPIVPVAVIGSEETYPVLFDVRPLAKLIGLPFFPITPQFPLFGFFSLVPLPSKWTIIFDAPIETGELGAAAADDATQVARLTELVRARIQGTLDERGAASRPAFFDR
jgi:1-acyl-sn-glycerol-3-phosphate acyltransferase